MLVIYFLFPGGIDHETGRRPDGIYDHRGMNCIKALRDVILYASGKLSDVYGRKIDDVISTPILHNNIGLIGVSNGGNIVIATPAIYGDEMKDYLKYIIQWESPVSSQIATVDLGPIRFDCTPNNFVNPRYISYNPLFLEVDFSDICYNASESVYKVFHDGNGDKHYTTITRPDTGLPTPDLNLNGVLELNEDFPLSSYTDGKKDFYSRSVTHALADNNVFSEWPDDIANPEEADSYWNLREAVRLYSDAIKNIPDLRGMILASSKDHVQSAPDKPHIHQAFDGWNNSNAWVKINPSPHYLIEIDSSLAERDDLPNNKPNIPPSNWSIYDYCIPEDIPDGIYQLASIHEMADRVYYNRWHNVEIKEIYGGFGINAVIKNSGVVDAFNISWSIDVRGILFKGKHSEGVISSLSSGEEIIIKSEFIFGIGPAEIVVKAGEESKMMKCFLLGMLVFI